MGLHFTPNRQPDDGPIGPTEAERELIRGLVAPSVLVMAADGTVGGAERRELIGSMRFNGALARFGAEVIVAEAEAMMVEMHERFGVQTLGALTEVLEQPLRETAVCMAIRIAMADGELGDSEHTMLVDLAMALEIAPETYNAMIDTMAILQRPG